MVLTSLRTMGVIHNSPKCKNWKMVKEVKKSVTPYTSYICVNLLP